MKASKEYCNKVYKLFYQDYRNKPFISREREHSDWIERAKMFPSQCLVKEQMMQPFKKDGLYPGQVYMLYWLKSNDSYPYPAYFEYKYGIDFDSSLWELTDLGYLENYKPTEKGEKAILDHYSVIKKHSSEDNADEPFKNDTCSKSAKPSTDLVENNLNGMKYEKAGNVDAAIELYNVLHGFEGDHPYRRLAIIYAKNHDVENEKRIIEAALQNIKQSEKKPWFKQRLK